MRPPRELPLPFSAPMVRAVNEERQKQTRRLAFSSSDREIQIRSPHAEMARLTPIADTNGRLTLGYGSSPSREPRPHDPGP